MCDTPYPVVVRLFTFSEHQNHAREFVKGADLSQWDALVIMSGDGLLYEVRTGESKPAAAATAAAAAAT